MHFCGVVAVAFKSEIVFESADGEEYCQRGFTMTIGVNTSDIRDAFDLIYHVVNSEAKQITEAFLIDQIEIQHIDKDDWDEEILESVGDFNKKVYYVSGKVFYSDD